MYSKKLSAQTVAKKIPLLKVIMKIKNLPHKRALLNAAGPELVDAASSIARNVLAGNLKIKNPRLRKVVFITRRKEFDALASLNTPHSKKRAILLRGGQKGGFIGAIVAALASVVAPLIVKAVGG